MSFSDYLEDKLLDHAFKGAAFTQPANVYVALFTAAPTDAGGGTEVSGNGYTRKLHNTWNAASGGTKTNNGEILFDSASGGNWGTVTHAGLFDAATGGNLLAWGALAASKAINDGDQARIADGDLSITLD